MRVPSTLAIAALGLAACSSGELAEPSAQLDLHAAATRTYEVTIDNLSTSQPLSPGVIVIHSPAARLFAMGGRASEGVRKIAEDGDPSIAAATLPAVQGVASVLPTAAPVFQVGGPGPSSMTVQISAPGAARELSLALMLICTNDGFVGLDGVALPGGFESLTYYTGSYDAGSETNDELSTSIVDACFQIGPVPGPTDGNARVPSFGKVAPHSGIQGGADLDPAVHGWTDPVAKVTISRIG